MTAALLLKVRVRDVLGDRTRSEADGQPQIAEVLRGDEVLGQLPFTRIGYEMLPHKLTKLTIELIVARAEISGHD